MNKKDRNEESKNNKEFFEAVILLSKDTGVTVDAMCESIQNVLIGALKKEYNNKDIVFCDVDADKGEFRVYLRKTVVSEISDPDTDLLVEQAQQYKKGAMPGDIVTIFGYDDDGTLVPCERLAAAQGTINYELLCQISKRIPRICHRGAETSQILQYIV